MVHKITSPKNQPQFSLMMMRQYWLGKTKPKQAFRSTRNAFNKLLRNLKIIYLTEFSTDCLTEPSHKRNSIMAKATGLIFSLFDVTSARQVPFGIPQYIHSILHGLTSVSHSPLLTAKSVDLAIARDGFPS